MGDGLLSVHCTNDAFILTCEGVPGFCISSPVSVDLMLSDGGRRGGVLVPEYKLVQPNGPHCEPTCTQSLARVQ